MHKAKKTLLFGILVNVSDCTFLKQAQEDIPKFYDSLAYLFIPFCVDRGFSLNPCM